MGGGAGGLLNKPQKAIRADVFPPRLVRTDFSAFNAASSFPIVFQKHTGAALYGDAEPRRAAQSRAEPRGTAVDLLTSTHKPTGLTRFRAGNVTRKNKQTES